MKHIKLFEEWSPNFNRTLQGAYGKAQSTNKGFGKATKAIMDYANRSISKKIFKVVTTREKEIEIVHHPEFILKPIDTFKKYNGELSKNKSFIVIPIKISPSNAEKIGTIDGQIGPLPSYYRQLPERMRPTTDFDLLFKDGKIYAMPASTAYTPTKREFSDLPEEKGELRFSSRVDIEDFFAMVIQAVLSFPEESSDIPGWGGVLLDKNLPGDTTEKQTILGLIKRLILDKDQRQYTM